jgi:uncharacterized protein YbaA (DUF1428 family)
MARYIDGFVFPIARNGLEEYKLVSDAVSLIYKEHGAINYLEFVGDDMNRQGTRSFDDLARSEDQDIMVFGWIEFESREARDSVNKKVEADPRMTELVAPLMNPEAMIFDPKRMMYGGFRPLTNKSNMANE